MESKGARVVLVAKETVSTYILDSPAVVWIDRSSVGLLMHNMAYTAFVFLI
jgi:hypothetical protein